MSPMNKLKVVLVTMSLPVMFGTQIQVVDSNVTEQIDTESGDTGGELLFFLPGEGGYNDFSDFVPPTARSNICFRQESVNMGGGGVGLGNLQNRINKF